MDISASSRRRRRRKNRMDQPPPHAPSRARRRGKPRGSRGKRLFAPARASPSPPAQLPPHKQRQLLEDEERDLEDRLDLLQRRARVVDLRRRVEELQARVDADEPAAHLSGYAADIAPRRQDDSRAFLLPEPRKYSASSDREYTSYIRLCEQHFDASPQWLSDGEKALFIKAWSEGETQDAVYRMLWEMEPVVPSWEEMKLFLRGLVVPEFDQDATRLHYSAKERWN